MPAAVSYIAYPPLLTQVSPLYLLHVYAVMNISNVIVTLAIDDNIILFSIVNGWCRGVDDGPFPIETRMVLTMGATMF